MASADSTTRSFWRPAPGRHGDSALGYATVPAGALLDGEEAEAQRVAIEEACAASGIHLADFVTDHEADREHARPALSDAFNRFEAGELSCLVVSDLERLTSSVDELAQIVDRLEKQQVRLIALDVGLDTATTTGRLAASSPQAAEPEPPTEPPADAAEAAAPERVKVFGYASAPHGSDDESENLERQRRLIERKCEEEGFDLVAFERDREPRDGKALERPGLSFLLGRVATGEASCIVVAGLERFSRSVAELGGLIRWMEQNDVRLVVVELELDTATSGGQTTARALASIGTLERDRLSERTRQGLAAARAKRRAAAGAGQPDWVALRTRIAAMRAEGMTLQAIADVLNEEGVPTQRGGLKWRPSSVQNAAGYKRRTRPRVVDELPEVQRASDRGPARKPPPKA